MNVFTNPFYGPLIAYVAISFAVSLVITVVYKYTTNQRLMKQLRQDIKKYQEQMRGVKETDKLMAIQKKAMDVNMKYMMQSLRPTLFTLLPILIIFGWISANVAYAQILPGEHFSVIVTPEAGVQGMLNATVPPGLMLLSSQNMTGGAVNFTFAGSGGHYTVNFSDGMDVLQKKLTVSRNWEYDHPTLSKSVGIGDWIVRFFGGSYESIDSSSSFKSVRVVQRPVHPFGDFSLFGYRPGWVATYIIFSLIFSMGLRKILDIN